MSWVVAVAILLAPPALLAWVLRAPRGAQRERVKASALAMVVLLLVCAAALALTS